MGEDPLGEEIAMRNRDRFGNPPLRGPADPDRVKAILDAAPDNREPKLVDPALIDNLKTSFVELQELQAKQRATTAKMIRACLSRIKSPDSRKRREGIAGLEQLIELLEKTDGADA